MVLFHPSSYPVWLSIHLATVTLSLALFVLRFMLDQRRANWRMLHPWLRWLPHVNDTLLLAAGIALCAVAGWRPWQHDWLAVKLGLLLLYIVAGKQALAPTWTLTVRRLWALGALVCVATMILLAWLKPL